jgi:deoxycytidylate deaminase
MDNGTPSGFENCCEPGGLNKMGCLHAEANAILKVARSTQSCEEPRCTLLCHHARNAVN